MLFWIMILFTIFIPKELDAQNDIYRHPFNNLTDVQHRVVNGDTLIGVIVHFNSAISRSSLETLGMNVQTVIEISNGNIATGEIELSSIDNLLKFRTS